MSSDNPERIVTLAADLFAQHGFHGVTTRQIAAAAQLNIATVHHHVGTKGELYARVLDRMQREENELAARFLEALDIAIAQGASALRALLIYSADAIVETMDRNPSRARLYMRRWLEPYDTLSEAQSIHSLRLYNNLCDAFARAQAAGCIHPLCEPGFLLRTLDWIIYGYYIGGPVTRTNWRNDPHDPEHREKFRRYLRDYLCTMLGLGAPV